MTDPRDVTERGLQAWRARDLDAFANCYADSATIAGPGGMALEGHDGARQFMSMWAEGVPDNEITIEHEWVAGAVVVQEGIFSGTHTGTLMTPDGQAIPATGRSIRAAYVDVFETEGDRIIAERLYFDQVELLTQLGLMPDPAAATSA